MIRKMVTALAMAAAVAQAGAQALPESTPTTGQRTAVAPSATSPIADESCCRAAAGTLVELDIAEPLSSKTLHRGDRFALRLHSPIVVGNTTLLSAGTSGVGEVVHAAPSGGGGKPGELLLAARYLEHDGLRVPLRGMKLGAVGKDNSQKAMAVGMAIGMFAQFIHGGEIEIPSGTLAQARLVQDLDITPSPVVPTALVPAMPGSTPDTSTSDSTTAVSTQE
jgi:hypothetical protein